MLRLRKIATTIDSKKKKKNWSLHSLASMVYEQQYDDQSDDNSTNIVNNINNNIKNNNNGSNNFNDSDNADILLQDVNIRLAHQYENCVEMSNQVLLLDQKLSSTSTSTSSSTNTNTNTSTNTQTKKKNKNKRNDKRRKVIKAVNQVITNDNDSNNFQSKFQEWMDQTKTIELEKQKAIKGLNNLQVLHADTFKVHYI
jgi:hypothetical protein